MFWMFIFSDLNLMSCELKLFSVNSHMALLLLTCNRLLGADQWHLVSLLLEQQTKMVSNPSLYDWIQWQSILPTGSANIFQKQERLSSLLHHIYAYHISCFLQTQVWPLPSCIWKHLFIHAFMFKHPGPGRAQQPCLMGGTQLAAEAWTQMLEVDSS